MILKMVLSKYLFMVFLHLLHFQHKSDKDYQVMNLVEHEIFKKIKG